LTRAAGSGIIGVENNSSVEAGDTDGMTTITEIKPIDFNDKAAIQKEIDDFAEKYAYAEVEHALELSPDGNMYKLIGMKNGVDSALIGKKALIGSIGTHNHPVPKGDIMGDSFSKQDLTFAINYNLGKQYLISGKRRNAFEFTQNITENELLEAWENAKSDMREKMYIDDIENFHGQFEILKRINKYLKGFEFYENF